MDEPECANDGDRTCCLLGSRSHGPQLAKPDFLIVSPAKTGSTWLFANLQQHPDIFIPSFKGAQYFSFFHKILDLDWYSNVFQPGMRRLKGDASPSYSILPVRTIRTIRTLYPDLKVIYLMRDPVARAWSHAKHNARYREANFRYSEQPIDDVPDAAWYENFAHPWPAAHGDYLGQLRRWTSVFPKDQLFVDFFERIVAEPESLLRDILGYLELRRDVDLTSFPLRVRINEGPRKPLSPAMQEHLRNLHAARSRQLADYLQDTFQLTCPPQWRAVLKLPSSVNKVEAEPQIVAPSHDDVGDAVDTYLESLLDRNPPSAIPVIEEGFFGYNLVWAQGRFFGVAQGLGPVDLGKIIGADFPQYEARLEALGASTLAELKAKARHAVDALSDAAARFRLNLIAEGFLGYNLVAHQGTFYALAQGIGPVNLLNLSSCDLRHFEERLEILSAPALGILKESVQRAAVQRAAEEKAEGAPARAARRRWRRIGSYLRSMLARAREGQGEMDRR